MQRCAQLATKFAQLDMLGKYGVFVAASTATGATAGGAVELCKKPRHGSGLVDIVFDKTIKLPSGIVQGATIGFMFGTTLPFAVAVSPFVIPASVAHRIIQQS
jgi:hypothetical protein